MYFSYLLWICDFFLYYTYRIVILMEALRVLYEGRTESTYVGVPKSVY